MSPQPYENEPEKVLTQRFCFFFVFFFSLTSALYCLFQTLSHGGRVVNAPYRGTNMIHGHWVPGSALLTLHHCLYSAQWPVVLLFFFSPPSSDHPLTGESEAAESKDVNRGCGRAKGFEGDYVLT